MLYVFKINGSKISKFFMLIAIYIIPLFILYYFGILNKLANPVGGIIISAFIVMLIFLFYYTALKLNLIELEDIIGNKDSE